LPQYTIYKALKERKVKFRTQTQTSRKYSINEHFFDDIDTESKAYWLGFLYADGHITKTNDLKLDLATIDKAHIFKLNNDMESSYPVKDRLRTDIHGTRRQSARLDIRSHHLVRSLISHGVRPDKTTVFTIYDLKKTLERHFWRGLIDGDGCLCLMKNPSGKIVLDLSVVGNQDSMKAFSRFVRERLGVETNVLRHRSIWAVRMRGKKALSVAEFLYGKSETFLERKKNKYLSVAPI
jgi:hypothetical protein